MILSWLRRRRRRAIVARAFPAEWDRYLAQNVFQFGRMTPDEQDRLRRWIQIFIAEKYWEGCNGLPMTDEVQVTVAAQAGRLLLGHRDEYFDRLLTVLVYPTSYFADERQAGPAGTVIEGPSLRLGEAWSQGPVVLAWPDVLAGGRPDNRGHNVVLHEFAHVLDMQDHVVDGTPPLATPELFRAWGEVVDAEYNLLVRRAEQGRPTLLDQYGTLNKAEFFAVATESFFERSAEMADRHPRLYNLLRDYYRQDPAAAEYETAQERISVT